MNRKAILLNVKDDVATALTDLTQGEQINAALENISVDVVLQQDIPFAHKYALHDIAEGEDIFKYGMPIGKALCAIRAGEWVSVHNCRSHRWGFQNDRYGLNA